MKVQVTGTASIPEKRHKATLFEVKNEVQYLLEDMGASGIVVEVEILDGPPKAE